MIKYKQKRENAAKRRGLVVYYHQDSMISEQYRRVYTNIKYCQTDEAHRCIAVVSPGYKAGRTTTTLNLGASIAQLGENVLLIDGDLRQPMMHTLFKTENTIGLSTILQGSTTLEEAVNQTGLNTLDILTSGPIFANPAKLLGALTMNRLVQEALNRYDIVLMDTPPFLEVTDANIIASVCSGVLFVIKQGKTKSDKIIETKRLLELSGSKVIGSMMNGKKRK
ncbi:MAG: CpsD/CapB family tyrosine-protein kinase [Tuberibacillus sp.]